MRLFLSSQDFGNHSDELLRLVGSNRLVVYIYNAKDYCTEAERAEKLQEHKEAFEVLGFSFQEMDLRDYFANNDDLKKDLSSYGLVWCAGGNTFLLRRALKDSGCDELLIKLLQEDKIAYGGSIAGSIVATPSLHGTENGDDPVMVEKIYHRPIEWSGLNLVSTYIIPHYESDWFGDAGFAMERYFKKRKIDYLAMHDGDVLVVDSPKQQLLS